MKVIAALISFILTAGAQAKVSPKVPESMEIAEVKLRFTSEARSEIQKEVDALRASEKFFQIKLDRINLYFPLMEKVLKEEGVPDDLKYLAVQESSLVSDAVSASDAVGYWQFKDFTAKEVGLRVDGKVDERKNIVSATHGAAKYFKRNNFYFRNWIYSVSAYQAGPGGAKRYVDEKNFGADKLTIDKNTHWYVKRYIAHVIAFKDEVGGPHSGGLRLLAYERGENKELKEIAREFKVDEDLVIEYNKWLKISTVPGDKPYAVIIPVAGKVRGLDEEDRPLSRTISEPKDRHTSHSTVNQEVVPIILNGRKALLAGASDDVTSLAVKGNILERQLLKFNDLEMDAVIQPGLTYYIQSKRGKADIPEHTVQIGETLWSISQKYGVRMGSLVKMNRLSSPQEIKAGQVLWMSKTKAKAAPVQFKDVKEPVRKTEEPVIEATSPQVLVLREKPKTNSVDTASMRADSAKVEDSPKEEPQKEEEKTKEATTEEVKTEGGETDAGLYRVAEGETLWGISQKFSLTVSELLTLNDLDKNATLKPGQELKVKKESFTIYRVESGDTLYGIARKYGMTVAELKSLNNKSSNTLSLGEELKVKVAE